MFGFPFLRPEGKSLLRLRLKDAGRELVPRR
jgi:hypothetical protein